MGINDRKTVFSDRAQDTLFQIEADSWWFQYRAKVITGLMERYFDKSTKTVDVGGGNGYTTAVAKQKGFDMSLLEPSEGACKNAMKRGIDAQVGMLTEEYPVDGEYKQTLLLDVLEHIEDDNGFLDLLHRKIHEGGLLLITVPAYMCLWSSEDDFANHYRRYTKRELKEKAEKAGFHVLYGGYFMQFLFLPILVVRVGLEKVGLLKRREQRTEEEQAAIMDKQFKIKDNGMISLILRTIQKAEYRRIMKGHTLSYGTSVVMVLRR